MARSTGARAPAPARLTVDQHKANVLKRLRKRDAKDIHMLAAELGVARQALARPLQQLVEEGRAKRTELKRGHMVYTKP